MRFHKIDKWRGLILTVCDDLHAHQTPPPVYILMQVFSLMTRMRNYSIWKTCCFDMELLLREMKAKGLENLGLAHLGLKHHPQWIQLGISTLPDLKIVVDMQRGHNVTSCRIHAPLVKTYAMDIPHSFVMMGYSNM